jgi:hypothetical protein
MKQSDLNVDSLLVELMASLSQPTGEAVLRRINAERLLRLLADEFIAAHQAERVRILPDERLAGQQGADFLLQIDDYDVRLIFLDTPDSAPAFDPSMLPDLLKLLEDNPSTVALVLVWTTGNLLAVPLSMLRARYLSQNPERLPALLADARPLPETLRVVVERQTKLWEVGLDQVPHTMAKSTDMRRLFEEAIGAAIDAERQRSYRYAERKLAARLFPIEEERRVIFAVLAEALAGAPAQELVPRLTRVLQRGGR